MKNLNFQFAHALLDSSQDQVKKLASHIDFIKKELKKGYDTDFASLNLPSDSHYHQQIMAIVDEKKKLNPAAIVLIGIGGSSLGAQAIYHACKPYVTASPEFFCIETVDPDYIAPILEHIDHLLTKEKVVVINAISKSGTTTETIALFQVFLSLLKKHHPTHYAKYVTITTDKNSPLWHLAIKEKFSLLEVPEKVGGRYSVFSAVGLFPLALLGFEVKQLLMGAQSAVKSCLDEKSDANPAIITALALYQHFHQGSSISDVFLFNVGLEYVGKWYRQLMAESLGKQKKGLTPTVSIGTTDLHSMVQLYLGGPQTRFTTFITTKKFRFDVRIPHNAIYADIVHGIQGRSLQEIMAAISQAVQITYKKNHLPFISIELVDTNLTTMGELLQYTMITMMYLGNVWEINPFDQPQVELYKQETRKILAHE